MNNYFYYVILVFGKRENSTKLGGVRMKKSKLFLLLCLVLALSVGMTACTSEGKPEESSKKEEVEKSDEVVEESSEEGGLMVFGIGSDPMIVNPLYADDRVSMTLAHILFDSLYKVEDGELVYQLAESMEPSEDFLTYTLKLREDVKWHDGEDFTADDMIFTLESILDEKQNAKGRNSLLLDGEPIGIEKLDDYTIEFKLSHVNIPFVENLSSIKPIPKHIFDGEGNIAESSANAEPVGNGAFKFKAHKTGELYEVERNDDYYGDVALLDGIAYRVIPDPNAALVALENGEISASYLKANEVEKFEDNDDIELITFSESMVNNIFFRTNNEKVSDVKARQAIAYGIDKDKIIEAVYKGTEFASPATSSFAKEVPFWTDDVEDYEYNPERAKELLKEAGKENLELRLMYTSGIATQEKEALLVQEMLKEIGVEIELLPMERGTFVERILDPENQDFEIATNGYVMGSNADNYSTIFTTGNANNFSGYSNPKVDELFDKAAIETDEDTRREMYEEIQKIVAEDVVQYPTAYPKSIIAYSKEFKGLEEAKPASIHMFDYYNKISK